MSRVLIARISACVLLLTLAWFGYSQNRSPAKLTLNKVTDDLYEIEGDGGNVAVYITNDGVILIDDKFDQDHQSILDHVKSIANTPVKYVINTHYHADHSGGNAKFLSTAEIISTAMARTSILGHLEPDVPRDIAPARITFTTETAVYLGGKEVRAHYFGRGHTNGDAVIYFPALRTIHTGDLMGGTTPLLDYNAGGSLVELIKTLDNTLKLDFDTVIPGHGPITNRAGLKMYRDNAEKLRNRVTGLVKEGKSQDEIGNVLETEYKWGSLQKQWSLTGLIQELK